jgi:hypothetical protein
MVEHGGLEVGLLAVCLEMIGLKSWLNDSRLNGRATRRMLKDFLVWRLVVRTSVICLCLAIDSG